MRFFRLAAVLVPLLLAACGLTDQEKADYAQVYSSGVGPVVYHKMVNGEELNLWDIKALTRARVDDGVILRYMREHKTVYYLNGEDIGELKTGGVSPVVIDYMRQTPQLYASYNPAIGNGFGYFPDYDPFWGPPYPNYPYPEHYWR